MRVRRRNKRGDYATALREFRTLAKQGYTRAQFNLASMYRYPHFVPGFMPGFRVMFHLVP